MKLYYFSEMPHHEFPDEEGLKYPSLRLEFPNRFFNPAIAASNYQRYLDPYLPMLEGLLKTLGYQ